MINKYLIEAINLLLLWLSSELTAMEGDDEKYVFLDMLRDDLRKLNKMLKEKENNNE